jgi:hypothetical protein
MGDGLAIDVDRVWSMGEACATAGGRAAQLATELRSLLASGELSVAAAVTLDELADELDALARFVRATVERVVYADQFGSALSGQGWFESMRRRWHESGAVLWSSLNDDVGASAMEQGSFSLAESLVTIERAYWQRAAIPPGCRSYGEGRGYTGGGALRGPDGELYPIVIPHLVTDGGHFTIDANLPDGHPSAASLGGADPGWRVIGYRTGVEQIRADAGWAWRIATMFAVGTGLPHGPSIDDEHLHSVQLSPGALPTYSTANSVVPGVSPSPAEANQSISPTALVVVDGRARNVAVDQLDMLRPGVQQAAADAQISTADAARTNLTVNATSLGIGLLQGARVAMNMNDSNGRAYEVLFEENDDGRRRARVQSFALEPKDDGVILASWHLFLDDEGNVLESPASYQVGPTLMSSDTVGAWNPIDPDLSWPISMPAMSGS